jgi:hypothetical protein
VTCPVFRFRFSGFGSGTMETRLRGNPRRWDVNPVPSAVLYFHPVTLDEYQIIMISQ